MFSVNSLEQLNQLERQNKFVAVFLATGFDLSALRWLIECWMEIHVTSGYRWHMVAPTKRPINDDLRNCTLENFDSALARDLARMYGLEEDNLPCLVFDSFSDEHRQLFVKFPASEKERRKLITAINKHIQRRSDAATSRQVVIEGLYDELMRRKAVKDFVGLVPAIGATIFRGSTGSLNGA